MGSGGARRKNKTWMELGYRYSYILRGRFHDDRIKAWTRFDFEYWHARKGIAPFLASRRDFEPDIGYGPAAWLYHWRKPKKYRYKNVGSRLCITTMTKSYQLYVSFENGK